MWRLNVLWRKSKETRTLLGNDVFRNVHGKEYKKKLVFHVLLLCSVLSDLPMYIDFIIKDDYDKSTYAFHNLQSALLFMAYSIMIRDWSKALFDIEEVRKIPFVLSKWSLIVVNICFTSMSLFSFVDLLVVKDIDEFLHSPVYSLAMYFQIAVSFTLSSMMLYTGLQLSGKIQGAVRVGDIDVAKSFDEAEVDNDEEEVAGIMYSEEIRRREQDRVNSSYSHHDSNLSSREQNANNRNSSASTSHSFRKALNTLNIVMGVQLSSILIQILMLFLNWILGYSTKSEETFVPIEVYWILYAWVPMYGMVLSLLYLARSSTRAGKTAKHSNKMSGSGALDAYIDPDVSVTHYDDDDSPYANMDYYKHDAQQRNSYDAQQRNSSMDKNIRLRFSPTVDDVIASPIMTTSSGSANRGSSAPERSLSRDYAQSRDTTSSQETISISNNSSIGNRNSESNSYANTNLDTSGSNLMNSSLIDLDVSLRTRPSESPHKHGLPMSFVDRDSEVDTVVSGDGR